MLHTADQADGTADELRRIEQDFQRQREQLAAGTAQFDDWLTDWRARQTEIDALLARLRQSLGTSGGELVDVNASPVTIPFTTR